MSRKTMTWVSGAVLAILPVPVLAYSGIGSTFGIVQGFVHPIGGLDHALAMIAVGIVAACIAIVHSGKLDAGLHFIAKRFSLVQIAAKMNEVLAGSPAR